MSLGYRDKILRAAGFMEGEGSFSWKANPVRGNRNKTGTHWMAAGQYAKEPLQGLQELFGGTICQRTRPKGFNVWTVTGANARGAMMMLYPFLSPRRQTRIKELLSRPGKWQTRVHK